MVTTRRNPLLSFLFLLGAFVMQELAHKMLLQVRVLRACARLGILSVACGALVSLLACLLVRARARVGAHEAERPTELQASSRQYAPPLLMLLATDELEATGAQESWLQVV